MSQIARTLRYSLQKFEVLFPALVIALLSLATLGQNIPAFAAAVLAICMFRIMYAEQGRKVRTPVPVSAVSSTCSEASTT